MYSKTLLQYLRLIKNFARQLENLTNLTNQQYSQRKVIACVRKTCNISRYYCYKWYSGNQCMHALHASDAVASRHRRRHFEWNIFLTLSFRYFVFGVLSQTSRPKNWSWLNVEEIVVLFRQLKYRPTGLYSLRKLELWQTWRKLHLSQSPLDIYADTALIR